MRLSVIYIALAVSAAHLGAIAVLWINSTSTPFSPSAIHSMDVTLLNAALRPLQITSSRATNPLSSTLTTTKKTQPAQLLSNAHSPQRALITPIFLSSLATPTAAQTSTARAMPKPAPIKESLNTTQPGNTLEHLECRIAKPSYPALSRQQEETGTTLIRAIVNTHGVIEQAILTQSSGFNRLDQAARQAVLASTCRPYQKNGQTLRAATDIRFQFNLHD